MKVLANKSLQTNVEKILEAHGLLEVFKGASDFYVKIECNGFMPLSIERHGKQITMAHYFEQNEDLVPDPDMEFLLTSDGWIPVAIQHSLGIYRRAVEFSNDGKLLVRERELADQSRFATMWSRNLRNQGFGKQGVAKIARLEHS